MGIVDYSRWRFTTGLPDDRLYTRSHCWIRDEGPGVWQVGLTAFAVWLLGDIVEYGFRAAPGTAIAAGQEVGWVEGLKAVQTIETPVEGVFLAEGDAIASDITALERDPYHSGWLFRARGNPAPGALDARKYAALLDIAVDVVKAAREAECGGDCEA